MVCDNHVLLTIQLQREDDVLKFNFLEDEENIEESDDKSTRAINEIVHELKYETDPAVIKLIRASDLEDTSNILPHVSVQTLDYATVTALTGDGTSTVEVVNDKDPLESVRNGDSL